MKNYSYMATLLAIAGLSLAGCGAHNHDPHDGHVHNAPESVEAESAQVPTGQDHAGIILLSDAQGRELGLSYETAVRAPFVSVTRVGGALEAAPGDRSTVVATTSGIVSFGGRAITEGTFVNRGNPFVILVSEGMVEGNYPQQLADAQADLAKAETDYRRAEALSGNKVVTAAEREALEVTLEAARRKASILSKNATKGGKGVVAPLSGYVTSLEVSEGDYVEAGQPLTAISANRNLILRGDLPQRYAAHAGTIHSARFTTPYDGKSYDLAEMKGRLIGSCKALPAGSATLPIRFTFENTGHLSTGSVVEVFLKGAVRENALTIPVTALTEEQGAYFIYVRTMPEHFVKRAVHVGETDGNRIEIETGLHEGEEVVTAGALYVRLASMSTEIPHGHAH